MKKTVLMVLMCAMLMAPKFSDINVNPLTQEQVITLNKFHYDYEKTFNNLLVDEDGEI